MTSSLNQQVDDQIVVLSQNYPSINTQLVTEQGPEVKQQRRRKKNKGETNCTTFKKRKLTDGQVNMLEFHFVNEHKLESERKDRLAADLGLDPRQVAVWFQNRRTRWKSKRLEDEYSKLKTEHESTVVEKCQLETQVLKLKEQITEAEKEMKKLMERCDGVSSNSQSPSFSTEVMEPPYLGEFGMEGLKDVFYLPEYAPENDYDINESGIWASVYSI